MTRLVLIFTAACLSLSPVPIWASSPTTVDEVLARSEPPPGVVFEVMESDSKALQWAVPQIAAQARRLRTRFPGLAIAVVSHGREMFALQASEREKNQALHALVQQLATRGEVQVHVCETYAASRGVTAQAFPDYVDVAPEGPAQIQNYLDLGYVRVKVTRPRR